MIPALIVLFVVYVGVTAFQMRRALATRDPEQRLVEAKRLLWTTVLGVPILVGFIFTV